MTTKQVHHTFTEGKTIIFHENYLRSTESQKKKMRILNKHLLPSSTPVEGEFQLPKVLPYSGIIPDVFIPYNAKLSSETKKHGIYCHIDDYRFNTVWTRPVDALKKVSHYMIAVAPDNTLWVDGAICENIEQIRRTRTIQRFWQNNGIPTIQTASWGNADSVLTYAFDGLAEHSWTAIGHQHIGSVSEQQLFRFAVMKLIETKHPIGFIVFGAPLNFDPGIPVIVKPSFISILRNL